MCTLAYFFTITQRVLRLIVYSIIFRIELKACNAYTYTYIRILTNILFKQYNLLIDKCTLKIHQSMKTCSYLEIVLYIIKYKLLNTVT